MVRTGVQLLLDVGICAKNDVQEWLDIGVSRVVISSESFPHIDQLRSVCKDPEAAEIVFSVDLKAGRLLVADESLQSKSPLEFVEEIINQGVINLIVLDLAAVGMGSGIPTLTLCQQIKERWPHVRLISGGGVHNSECLRLARQAGLDGLLIGSALHDGRLSPSSLRTPSTHNLS
jgi:phosphoribosylformimino-5-aminoimidazole carboxamide ribotide isomerase